MSILYCKRFYVLIQALLFIVVVSEPVVAQEKPRPDPEMATGVAEKSAAIGQDFMIVTANPHASEAGYSILKRGGSAVDAAVAAQLVLGLVEPQSSGLGGGAFVLYYDAKEKKLITLDGRETVPSLASPFLFAENGEPMEFMDAVVGGRSVGVPGVPMLLATMHEQYGTLTWMELFDDAIDLARDGFEISPRLAALIGAHKDRLGRFPETARYFLDWQGEALKAGTLLKNSAYEETLKDFAFYGASRFYRGGTPRRIVATVQNISENPGLLTARDFANYEVKKRDPVCGPYRTYIVCSMGEPSSGGLTLLQILGMVERFDLREWGADNAKSWHVIAEASRMAFADRALYMADPDFVNTPGVALIDPQYINTRSAHISPNGTLEDIEAGTPPGWEGPLYNKGVDISKPGTSHISVIDKDGNIVSMTTTIEGAFGSHVMVDGFLLNNELTDFSFKPLGDDGAQIANMVEPGKRPRSSMSPTIVFDKDGEPVLVIGSAGGSNIIGYVLQRIIAVLDWDMDIQDALAMPNILSRGNAIEMEVNNPDLVNALIALDDSVQIKEKNSGLTAIHITSDGLKAAADPRREGMGMGD